jgi:hypothetical protein
VMLVVVVQMGVEIAVTNAALGVVKCFLDGNMWKERGKRRDSRGSRQFSFDEAVLVGGIASCTEVMSGSLRVHGSWQNHDIATEVGARAHEIEEGSWEKSWTAP